MKKISIFVLFLVASYLQVFSQNVKLDSIFLMDGIILANVKEITPDLVKYGFPEEETVTAIYNNAIRKIRFKSGRTQFFSEAIAFDNIRSAYDYEKIKITRQDKDVLGLLYIDEFTVDAYGTNILANVNTVKARTIQKAKMKAALLGGKIVHSLESTTISNPNGTQYEVATSINASIWANVYTDNFLKISDFKNFIKDKKNFKLVKAIYIGNYSTEIEEGKLNEKSIEIDNIYEENQLIYLKAKGYENEMFRVISFDNTQIILAWKNISKNRIYNLYLIP